MSVFDAISRSREGLSLTELSEHMHAPKSSLLSILKPLVSDRYLVRDGARYRLGSELYGLAANILSTREFTRLMQPFLQAVAVRTGETIVLAVLDEIAQHVSYIAVVESTQLVRYVVMGGAVRPLHASAAGQVLAAYQPAPWRDRWLCRRAFEKVTENTLTDPGAVRSKIAGIRRRGYAISRSEAVPEAWGCAAPIFHADGSVAAALLVGAPAERASRMLPSYEAAVREIAADASRVLGYTPVLDHAS